MRLSACAEVKAAFMVKAYLMRESVSRGKGGQNSLRILSSSIICLVVSDICHGGDVTSKNKGDTDKAA
jgi:glycerate-2-kinase